MMINELYVRMQRNKCVCVENDQVRALESMSQTIDSDLNVNLADLLTWVQLVRVCLRGVQYRIHRMLMLAGMLYADAWG